MKFLFVCQQGRLLPFCRRVIEEGHKGTVLSGLPISQEDIPCQVIEGLGGVKQALKQDRYDVAVVDGDVSLKEAEFLSSQIPTIGPNRFTKKLAENRPYLSQVGAATDLLVPPLDSGPPFLISSPKGVIGEAEDEEQLAAALELEAGQPHHKPEGQPFLVGGLFDGHQFVPPAFMQEWWSWFTVGDMGPWTIEPMGIVTGAWNHVPKVHQETVHKLGRMLQKTDYRGPIAVRAFLTDTDVASVEVVQDFRLLLPFLELWRSTADTLASIAMGKGEQKIRRAWACSVGFLTTHQGARLLRLNEQNAKHLRLLNVAKDNGGLLAIGNPVGYSTAWGQDSGEARRRAYRTLKSLRMPGLFYRNDVGARMDSTIAFWNQARWV